MSVRVRFAPSPTGFLHVGNVRTALFNWLFARKMKGSFILRIEDTDAERSEDRFEQQLVEDLQWLKLQWDEGVVEGGQFGPYRQRERLSLYRKYAKQLLKSGEAYYCFCTAEQLEEDRQRQRSSGSIKYVGRCREIPPETALARVRSGEGATIRLRVPEGKVSFTDLVFGPLEVDTDTIGDFIIVRSDGSAQYNLACVVDDTLMEITHVIRGEGHISNTYRQLLIYWKLGIEPPMFAHLSTILGPDGSKLSKRHGATSIMEFRELGYLPSATVNYLALLGWSPEEDGEEVATLNELVERFSIERVNVSPATFDMDKLNWVNRSHLKSLSRDEVLAACLPFLQRAEILPEEPSRELREWAGDMVEVLTPYLDRFSDIGDQARVVTRFDPEKDLGSADVQEVLNEDGAHDVIRAFEAALTECSGKIVDFETYKTAVTLTKERTGRKGKNLFRPIRVAITGRASGPELDRLLPIIEKGSTLDLLHPVIGVRNRVDRVCELLQVVGKARS